MCHCLCAASSLTGSRSHYCQQPEVVAFNHSWNVGTQGCNAYPNHSDANAVMFRLFFVCIGFGQEDTIPFPTEALRHAPEFHSQISSARRWARFKAIFVTQNTTSCQTPENPAIAHEDPRLDEARITRRGHSIR
jgi:hypothetical protein